MLNEARRFRSGPRHFGIAFDRPVLTLFPPERVGDEAMILSRIRRGESVLPFDTERMTKDGRKINISVSVSPVRDSQGRVVGASKIARDITEAKQAQVRHEDPTSHRNPFSHSVITSKLCR